MINIAILASGSGSNAEAIVHHFRNSSTICVALILTNRSTAGVVQRAERLGVPCLIFDRAEFNDPERFLSHFHHAGIDVVVLAGFLWLVPTYLVKAFDGKILNIHPALLPEFGGKGFYGDHVHRAVLASGKPLSGITIHKVNEHFDEGDILFQAACHVDKTDTVELLAQKVHALEHRFFPVVIEKFIGTMPESIQQ